MITSQKITQKSFKNLTVMQVIPRLHVGGVERGTVEFSIFLKQHGHRPIVVSYGGPLVEVLEAHGIEHIHLNVAKKSVATLLSVNRLSKIINEYAVDVVHARSRIPAWLCCWALKKLKRRPVFITTLHGLHSVNKYSSVMARGDRVIAVSEVAKTYLNTHFKAYLKEEPVVIYRGIDKQFKSGYQPSNKWLKQMTNKFNSFMSWKKVLLPGRLSAVKGIENLLFWLESSAPDIRLLLNALPDESNYSKKINQLISKMGLSEKVVWLGVERSMPDLYAAVDIVVSANNKPESFGRTVLEALSVGTPVVATEFGGVAEIMHKLYPQGLIGHLCREELADKINVFLKHAPLVEPHDLFRNETMFEQTLALYHESLDS